MTNQKTYKENKVTNINMLPGDPQGSPDESLNSILVFIDEAFLSKLSQFFGNGKYIKFDRMKLSKLISEKEGNNLKSVFLYTAPPFLSTIPSKEEILRKEGYDKFIDAIRKDNIIVREGRCQRIKIGNDFIYNQKAVDMLLGLDLIFESVRNNVKKIILIASDSDFVPAIKRIEELGIKTVLYTFYEKKRDTRFSRSNHLIKSVYKYQLIKKEDFEKCKID